MKRTTMFSGAVAIGGLGAMLVASPVQNGAPPPGAPPGAQNPVGVAGPARGGGRGPNPAALLYTEKCSSCHGTDLGGGRAPSLFEEKWLGATSDEAIASAVKNGVPGSDMNAFKELTDEQMWQITQYIRAQSGVLRIRPAFIPELDGVVIKSEKQSVRMEVLAKDLNTPWGSASYPMDDSWSPNARSAVASCV